MCVCVRDKLLKLLVELLGSSSQAVVVSSLRLVYLLMLKYEWRVSFATEGGVKAVLSCMQEFSTVTRIQQLALVVGVQPPSASCSSSCHFVQLFQSFVVIFITMPIVSWTDPEGDHGSQ